MFNKTTIKIDEPQKIMLAIMQYAADNDMTLGQLHRKCPRLYRAYLSIKNTQSVNQFQLLELQQRKILN